MAESLPNVASKRITQFVVNPQVSELIQKFDGAIDSNLSLASRLTEGSESSFLDSDEQNSSDNVETKLKRPPPPLIPLSAVISYSQNGIYPANSLDLLVTNDSKRLKLSNDDS